MLAIFLMLKHVMILDISRPIGREAFYINTKKLSKVSCNPQQCNHIKSNLPYGTGLTFGSTTTITFCCHKNTNNECWAVGAIN